MKAATTLDTMFVVYCHCVLVCLQVRQRCRPQQAAPELQGHGRCICRGTAQALAPAARCVPAATGVHATPQHTCWARRCCSKSLQTPCCCADLTSLHVCMFDPDRSAQGLRARVPVLQVAPGCCTSCLTQWRSCSCCGAWLLPSAAPRMGRSRRPCRSVPQRLQPLGRSCQRSGPHGCCSGARCDRSVTSYMVYVFRGRCVHVLTAASTASKPPAQAPVDAGPCQGM